MTGITDCEMHEEGGQLCWDSWNKGGYQCGVYVDKKKKVAGVWVEDSYYNFEISFDKFLEIAEKIKEVMEKKK